MELIAETTSFLSTRISPHVGTRDKLLGTRVRAVTSAITNLVRRVNETAIRRFWEWAAIGFAFRGYTPL